MKLLALDTVSRKGSVAIVGDDGNILDAIESEEEHEHARYVVVLMELALSRNGLWYDDIDVVAVTTGPGSFTGIRVGLSAALAIECAGGQRLIGISNFEIYKQHACSNPTIVLTISRNHFIVLHLETIHQMDRKSLDELLVAGNYDSLSGDRPEILSAYPRYRGLAEPAATICGTIGHAMATRGDFTYPKPAYATVAIKKR